jgi:hypothetical protein
LGDRAFGDVRRGRRGFGPARNIHPGVTHTGRLAGVAGFEPTYGGIKTYR